MYVLLYFHTANNWGCDGDICGVGLGTYQEEFRGCSDIAIQPSGRPLTSHQQVGSPPATHQQTTAAEAETERKPEEHPAQAAPSLPEPMLRNLRRPARLLTQPTLSLNKPVLNDLTQQAQLQHSGGTDGVSAEHSQTGYDVTAPSIKQQENTTNKVTGKTTEQTTESKKRRKCRGTGRGIWQFSGRKADEYCDIICNYDPPFCPASYCMCDTN